MDYSKLSYSQITSIAGDLKSSSSQMESILSEIKTLFNKIGTDEVWSGTAASSAKERFDQLSAKFPEFSKAIDDCHRYLLQSVENYQSVDKSIMSQM